MISYQQKTGLTTSLVMAGQRQVSLKSTREYVFFLYLQAILNSIVKISLLFISRMYKFFIQKSLWVVFELSCSLQKILLLFLDLYICVSGITLTFLPYLENACDATKQADLGAIVMQEGMAHVCLVTSSMTIVRAKIEVNIPRKRRGNCSQHDKVLVFIDLPVFNALRLNLKNIALLEERSELSLLVVEKKFYLFFLFFLDFLRLFLFIT